MTEPVERVVRELVATLPEVSDVRLVGSRADGTSNPLSDWDFALRTTDFSRSRTTLPVAAAALRPLGSLWDPLSRRANFMLVLDGPTKIDLLFDEPQNPRPAWTATPASLPAIDCHFWDWILWLGSKAMAGRNDLVGAELAKLTGYLLEPMGATGSPSELAEAVTAYLEARERLEARFGKPVPRDLGNAVEATLRQHHVLPS